MAIRPATPDLLGPLVLAHLEDLVPRAEDAEGTPELGELAEEVSTYYRTLGICLFADEGEPDALLTWLVHSALTRRHYLETVGASAGGEPQFLRVSMVDPVLDALAARQWKLAGAIGRLASPTWLADHEYEDDFCYGEFLRLVSEGSPAQANALLKRWKTALEGGSDFRLGVAQALLAKDPAGFEDAVRALVRDNERRARETADPITGSVLSSDYPFAPNRWVSVEGLALLAVAERDGLPVDFDVEGCPRLARSGLGRPFQSLGYPHLGLE